MRQILPRPKDAPNASSPKGTTRRVSILPQVGHYALNASDVNNIKRRVYGLSLLKISAMAVAMGSSTVSRHRDHFEFSEIETCKEMNCNVCRSSRERETCDYAGSDAQSVVSSRLSMLSVEAEQHPFARSKNKNKQFRKTNYRSEDPASPSQSSDYEDQDDFGVTQQTVTLHAVSPVLSQTI